MKTFRLDRKLPVSAFGLLALCLAPGILRAQVAFQQLNLVSDIPNLAINTDPHLINPWGISSTPTSPFWVSDGGNQTASLYNSSGTPQSLVVTIPGPGGPAPSVPTGQVFNSASATGAFNGDLFIFASATGTIAGWRAALGTTAETLVPNADTGASYLGITLATISTNTYLYAANFGNGRIDVFPNGGAPALTGTFLDPGIPAGYSPFNIQNIANTLFVSYALKGANGRQAVGAGDGFVDRFDLNGNLLGRFASNGVLDAPWGFALAPTGFGSFGGDLLVGNFGDGTINAFDFSTGSLIGTLKDVHGNPLVNEDLWGIKFGNGGQGGDPGTLYFAAGIQNETHGLFGAITPVPEPATTGAIAGLGLVGLCAAAHLRRRKIKVAAAV